MQEDQPSQLPRNPKDDNASVQAALQKLHTLRKLSMSGAGSFTPLNNTQPPTTSNSRANSSHPSRSSSRPGSPGDLPMPNVKVDFAPPGGTSSVRSEVQSPSGGGAFDALGQGEDLTANEARALSVPSTPHFGAQTNMLKTLDESTKVIRQSSKMSGAQTPSVSGIGTLLEKPDHSEAKIVVAMVGLPARGKSYLSNKLMRYLRWLEYKVEVFNVGQLRRRKARDSVQAGEGPQDHSHNYFSSTNAEATALRENLASESLESLITWLKEGGNVGIHDATNSTRARRAKIQERIDEEPGFQVIFLESWCDDPEIIASNVALKARSGDPDYKNMSKEEAERDFRKRIEQYESVYETIEESNISWCKILNVGRQVQINRIEGYLQSRIAFYLMNLHLKPRHIYLSRHGESMHNVGGMIGGDSQLSPRGERYASALPALVLDNIGDKPLQVWTSTLQRTIATARNLPYPKKTWKSLDELDAGVCDGMTYEEISEKYPEDYAARDENKFGYRYRGGESYQDVVVRLEPVIMELERQENIVIICHQAIIRCLYGYFMGLSQEELPYIKVPLHTLIRLTPMAYGCEEERFAVPIPAVDTHRPKPARKNTADGPATEKAKDTTARDYFGDSKNPTIQASADVAESHIHSSISHTSAEAKIADSPQGEGEVSKTDTIVDIPLDVSQTSEQMPSQADVLQAMQEQSALRNSLPTSKFPFPNLPVAEARNVICTNRAASSGDRVNKYKMVCPREGCNSTILNAEEAKWVTGPGNILSHDPAAPFPQDLVGDNAEPDQTALLWHVSGVPMVFENIGFSRKINNVVGSQQDAKDLKWLLCAECDLGPLGWCYEGGTEAWISPTRINYTT